MADQYNKNQGKGDDAKPIIDLSDAQLIEETEADTDDDILLDEAALLGLEDEDGTGGGSGTSDDTSGAQSSKFYIPNIVKDKYPSLVPLILQTESMDNEEREYWFQILPIMTDDQVLKFKEILISEKQQLAKLDTEYEEELKKINDKHLVEWQDFEKKQERETLQKKERIAEAEEISLEEDILKKLNDL